MSYEEMLERDKVRTEITELTSEEREILKGFMSLGETRLDRNCLADAWLKRHHQIQRKGG